MPKFKLKENQYLPRGLGYPAATYYYFTNEFDKVVDFKTLKPYSGKMFNRFAMKSKVEAEAYLEVINRSE